MSFTAMSLNGELKVRDVVLSTPDNLYACLVGQVLEITKNETDDVHVDFTAFRYSEQRVEEIKADFGGLCLNDVIMNPAKLIRITDISDNHFEQLIKNGFNAACYCYEVIKNRAEVSLIPDKMEILNAATSGFKIVRIVNGSRINIELTNSELSNAFYHQETKYHLEDIKIILSEMPQHESILANESLLSSITDDYREELEEQDEVVHYWRNAAIKAIKKNMEK